MADPSAKIVPEADDVRHLELGGVPGGDVVCDMLLQSPRKPGPPRYAIAHTLWLLR